MVARNSPQRGTPRQANRPAGGLRLVVEAPTSDCCVVAPSGEIDAHTSPDLREAIDEQLLDARVRRLVVDLSRTTFLDSSALGVLIATLKRMGERGGRLAVVEPPPTLRRIFEITALDRVLELHPSREAALRTAAASS